LLYIRGIKKKIASIPSNSHPSNASSPFQIKRTTHAITLIGYRNVFPVAYLSREYPKMLSPFKKPTSHLKNDSNIMENA
jgi:hypothetical protein